MYPRMIIDIEKLKRNLKVLEEKVCNDGNRTLMVVTKGVCGDKEVSSIVAEHKSVSYMADSRVKNIATYHEKAHEHGKETVLLRLPMQSEIEEVIKYVDLSFNSELETIILLNDEACKREKRHKILLMIDLGDLREGLFYKDEDKIFDTVSKILEMKNIILEGIGVNLSCYGGIIPTEDNLSQLIELGKKIEEKFNITINMISGGNSSSLHLIDEGSLPKGINNLRLGEAFLLGYETAYGNRIEGTSDDGVTCEAQIIELKEKPSLPIGKVGRDAFGNVPEYEDRGIILRAIVAIGQQDTEKTGMIPKEEGIEVLGASSDHLILDVTHAKRQLKVGDVIEFKLDYGAMLKCATSQYVEKAYKK